MSGHILQLNLKSERPGERGLPKQAVARLEITVAGVGGDYNRWRTEQANGDRDQAVLLVTEECLAGLRDEGWPVQPGDLGENVTLGGIREATLRPGVQVHLGAVRLEISKACEPCTVLYTLPYVGATRGPAFLRTMRGRRGWFARVLQGGVVERDSPVRVLSQGREPCETPNRKP